jgi:hypothetical protein
MSRLHKVSCLILLLVTGLSSCTSIDSNAPAVSPSDAPKFDVLFLVEVPSVNTSPGTVLFNLLDEVTGLALNPTTITMEKRDDTHFSVVISINQKTLIKYRYTRSAAVPIMEVDTAGEDIRYRLALVDAPMTIYDTVPAWEDYFYQGGTGKIVGSVLDLITNTPVPNIVVSAGGRSSITSSDGSFTINGLPDGTHNLVAYTLDGSYLPFQQGAKVLSGLTTPAEINIVPGQPVNITFLLKAPPEYNGLPVRLAGNISQLGNTFTDLSGGVSVAASRMPIMAGLEDNRRYVTISVSAGTYIEYKYTLGDGFWNSEFDNKGNFKLRGFVVPAVDTIIQDEVFTWTPEGTEPIQFDVVVPESTPSNERVSIQFNPFGWMEPIPMWLQADHHWIFTVYNPLNLVGNFTYRYCRNELCGIADDAATAGIASKGRSLPTDTNTVRDSITSWQSLDPVETVTLGDAVLPYGEDYLTGIELSPLYHPGWLPYLNSAMEQIKLTNANTITLTPAWTCTDPYYPECDLSLNQGQTWQEIYEQIWQAQQLGLNVILYPNLRFSLSEGDWWNATQRTPEWWSNWFASYKRFIIHHADLAERSGVTNLIIGGTWIQPSLPGGKLPDGSDAQAPADSIVYWVDIIDTLRSHYSGKLIWELNYPASLENPPPFLNNLDAFYITFNDAITSSSTPNITELLDNFGGIIDSSVYPLRELYNKPIYIGINYPSADGSANGCMVSFETPCGIFNSEIQTDIYRAALTVVNYREWLDGFISQGFYPPAPA